MPKLEPILLKQMDFNMQVGVIGHKLSHVSDFTKRNIFSMAGSGIGHIFLRIILTALNIEQIVFA